MFKEGIMYTPEHSCSERTGVRGYYGALKCGQSLGKESFESQEKMVGLCYESGYSQFLPTTQKQ